MLGDWEEGRRGAEDQEVEKKKKSWDRSFQQQRRGFLVQTAGRGAGPTWETGCAPGGSDGSSSVSCWSPWSAGRCTPGWYRTRCTSSSRGRRRWHWSTSSTRRHFRLSSKVNTVTALWLKGWSVSSAGDGGERESERHAGLPRENRDFVVVVLTLKWLHLLKVYFMTH